MPKPQRVSIIGDSASGKTHIAQTVSQKLNLPVYDLEDIDWEVKFSKKRESTERDNLLKRLSFNENGIFLGVPSGWNDQFILSAQTILALDVSPHIRAYRLARRYILRKMNKRPTETFYKLLRNVGHALLRPSPTKKFLLKHQPRKNLFILNKEQRKKINELLDKLIVN